MRLVDTGSSISETSFKQVYYVLLKIFLVFFLNKWTFTPCKCVDVFCFTSIAILTNFVLPGPLYWLFYDVTGKKSHFCWRGNDFFPATSAKNQQRGIKQNSSTLQENILKKEIAGVMQTHLHYRGNSFIWLNRPVQPQVF
jgi:hypothetical protein